MAPTRQSPLGLPSALVAAIVALSFGGLVPFLGREALAGLLVDDAYYYFTIARNVAFGHGFTFDGLHRTNGFQPLWGLILVPLFRLVTDDVLALRLVLALQVGLITAAATILFRVLAGRIGRGPAATGALAIACFPGAGPILRTGMESALLLFLLVVSWRFWLGSAVDDAGVDRDGIDSKRWLALGLLLGLCFLARLEAIVALPALVIATPQQLRRRDRRGLLTVTAPVALCFIAYLAWNRIAFDTWIPVSGMVKGLWRQGMSPTARLQAIVSLPWVGENLMTRLFHRPSLFSLPPVGLALYGLLVAATAVALWRCRRSLRQAIERSGTGFLLLACVAIVGLDKLTIHYLRPWNQPALLLATAIAIALVASLLPRLAWPVVALMAGASLLRLPWELKGAARTHEGYAQYRIETADWLRENTQPGFRIGSWNAGMLGYFSHRHVVNLDGLVNDVRYYRMLAAGQDLERYFETEGIDWLADQGCLGQRPARYLQSVHSGHLDDRYEVVHHFYNAANPNRCPGFFLWRARSADDAGAKLMR